LLQPTSRAPPLQQDDAQLLVRFEPLVGGPRFLPLHVVVEHGEMEFDFLPVAPRAPSTALALLSGGATEGRIRCRPRTSRAAPRALVGMAIKEGVEISSYATELSMELRLQGNDCWTFAANLRDFACAEAMRETEEHAT